MDFVKEKSLKAFVQVFVAPTLRSGFHNLMVGAGLGAMTCNTVVFPLFDHKREDDQSDKDDGVELVLLSSPKIATHMDSSEANLIEMLESMPCANSLCSQSQIL